MFFKFLQQCLAAAFFLILVTSMPPHAFADVIDIPVDSAGAECKAKNSASNGFIAGGKCPLSHTTTFDCRVRLNARDEKGCKFFEALLTGSGRNSANPNSFERMCEVIRTLPEVKCGGDSNTVDCVRPDCGHGASSRCTFGRDGQSGSKCTGNDFQGIEWVSGQGCFAKTSSFSKTCYANTENCP